MNDDLTCLHGVDLENNCVACRNETAPRFSLRWHCVDCGTEMWA